MDDLQREEHVNSIPGIRAYVKYYGDDYFKKSLFGYKPIAGPDGKRSNGALVNGPSFKLKRGDVFTRRQSEIIPGWGTIAGNLTMTQDFKHDLEVIMNQPGVEGVFWIDPKLDKVIHTYFHDNDD